MKQRRDLRSVRLCYPAFKSDGKKSGLAQIPDPEICLPPILIALHHVPLRRISHDYDISSSDIAESGQFSVF